MRHLKRTYDSPVKAWQKERLIEERKLMSDYGLKSKRELWKVQTKLRRFRREARRLTATIEERQGNEFLKKLNMLGLIEEKSALDDVLDLEIYSLLNRRLQTLTFKKGLAQSIKEARQLIIHGHIYVENNKVDVPSYIVKRSEEDALKKI